MRRAHGAKDSRLRPSSDRPTRSLRRASRPVGHRVVRWRRASRCRARARNHVRWRLAKATLRWASSVDRRLARRARRRGRPTPRGSRWRRTPAAPGRSARGAPRASSMRPASNWARARAAIRAPVVGRLEPRGRARRPAPGSRAAGGSGASPRSSAISRARTTRRGLRRSIARREARREASQPRDERRQAVGGQVRLEPGADGRRRSAARRCRGRGRPRAGRARCRRRGSRRRRAPRGRARTPRAWAAKSATLNGSSGSTRSRPWCGTRARSAAVALAVPMSRPR